MKYRTSFLVALTVLVTAFSGQLARADDGDPVRGQMIFNKCKMCHTVIEGPKKIGPHLRNIIGRKAGSVPAFRYSKAMAASEVVWDEQTLDQFLKKPAKFMRKNQMTFSGIRKDQQRLDLIAYLKKATAR